MHVTTVFIAILTISRTRRLPHLRAWSSTSSAIERACCTGPRQLKRPLHDMYQLRELGPGRHFLDQWPAGD
jgi:hypothetical protein